jgi:hypothetical protein
MIIKSINKLKQNTMLYEERLKSVQKTSVSNNIFFSIYSILVVIFILMVLVLLRKLHI